MNKLQMVQNSSLPIPASEQGCHLRGAGGPSPPRKKKKRKKERKKRKKREKRERKEGGNYE